MRSAAVMIHRDFPPLAQMPEGAEPWGFEVDIVREVGRRTGNAVGFVGGEPEGVLKSLKAKYLGDVVTFAAVAPNPEWRQFGINFGTPYFVTKRQLYSVAGRSVDPKSPHSIAVAKDSEHARVAKQYYPMAELREYPSHSEAYAAMVAGEAQCLITLVPSVLNELKSGYVVALSDSLRLDREVGFTPAYPSTTSPAFRAAIDGALRAMLAEGWITALAQRQGLPIAQPQNPGAAAALGG